MVDRVNGQFTGSAGPGAALESVEQHEAVIAWMRLGNTHLPDQIEALRTRKKSQVFRLRNVGPQNETVIAKRCWAETANIERIVYENVLPSTRLEMPRFYGYLDAGDDLAWLFVEDIGDNQYSPAIDAHRESLARWLACLHSVRVTDDLMTTLPDRGPVCYFERMRDGRDTMIASLDNPALNDGHRSTLRSVVAACSLIEAHWNDVVHMCRRMPRAVIHGDLGEKHRRICSVDSQPVFQSFDWEHAGVGMPGLDLQGISDTWTTREFETYLSIMHVEYPRLSADDVSAMSAIGRVLQRFGAIKWAAMRLAGESVEKGMAQMEEYDRVLATTIAAFQWNS